MIEALGIILAILIFYISSLRIINFLFSLEWCEKQQKMFKKKKYGKFSFPYFIILLPMVREQSIVKETLTYLNTLNYPKDKLKIVVVTTEKEHVQKKKLRKRLQNFLTDILVLPPEKIKDKYVGLFPKDIFDKVIKKAVEICQNRDRLEKYVYRIFDTIPSTYDLAKKTIKKLNKSSRHKVFFIVHYPYKSGRRADELNYALKKICKGLKIQKDRVYVSVYDADSQPDRNTLLYIAYDSFEEFKKCKRYPEAYQQPSLYLKNVGEKSEISKSIIMKSNGLFQTFWCLGYELPTFLYQSKLIKSGKPKSILRKSFYCTGHGEFFRLDILEKIRMFPTFSPTDGIAIGYIANFLNIPVKPLPFFDLTEVPISMRNMFKQHILWFGGSVQILPSLFYAKKIKKKVDFQDMLIVFERLLRDFKWAFGPLTFLVVTILITIKLLLEFTSFTFITFLLLLLSMSAYSYLTVVVILSKYKKLVSLSGNRISSDWTFLDKFLILFLSPVLVSLKSIGPNLFFFKKIENIIFKKKIEYSKTER